MMKSSVEVRRWVALGGLLLASILFFAACGGGEEDPLQCQFGIAQGGECVNKPECLFQADCLPGWSCRQGQCTADQTCSTDDECDAGICGAEGVCVNPETCSSNDECVAKTYCSDAGTCEADPCSAITCVRGACVPGSGECTSKESCTKPNELFDCVQGERCLGQTCLGEDDYCDQLDCDRGVCSFVDGACVSASDCGGDDSQCLQGEFCNENNECREDRCVTDDVTCDDGGVCVPSVGECQNATTCSSNDDCLGDHWCVEGTCELQSVACGSADGDGGCFGQQECEYDDSDQTATCVEPDTCETSLDCADGRQCGGAECVAAATCQDDLFEPNNSDSEATDFLAASRDQYLEADLCDSDTDYYRFDSNALEPFTVRGVLTVQLDYADRDLGLGELEMELLKEQSDGSLSSVATDSAGVRGQDGQITLEQQLGPADQGTFVVAVRGAGDISGSGVSYALSVQLLDDPAINACDSPRTIQSGEVLTADMRQATSSLFRGSCVATDSTRAEQVFSFDVTEPSMVSAVITPEDSTDDPAVSIRDACSQLATERACSNSTSEGAEQIDDLLLSPGTYYVVVEPSSGGSLGRYDLALQTVPASCAASSNVCADENTSEYCVGGDSLETASCTNGCDPTLGLCFPVDGDVCETTTVIDTGTTETISWGELRDDYRAPGCVSEANGSTQSDGRDRAFQLEVPAGYALTATLTMASGEEGSLYVVEDCGDASNTCLAGANADSGETETVAYGNRDASAKTVFLVADTAGGQVLTDSQLEISFTEIICDPNGSTANRCAPGGTATAQICNEAGTEYLDDENCNPWVCDSGGCVTPNTCSDVIDMTTRAQQVGGATITGTWNEYTADVSGSGCTVDAADTDGYDFVVSVDLQAGEAVTANLATLDSIISADPTLHVQSSCGALDSSTCKEADHGDSQAQVVYSATQAETVYITADTASDSSNAGSEDFEFNIAITSTCDPATYVNGCDSGAVAYCTQRGAVTNYACTNDACTSGLCDVRDSDWCFDAENITAAATSASGFSRTVDWTTLENDFSLDGACDGALSSGQIDGYDTYFRVDLVAGEVLEAQLGDGPSGITYPALAVVPESDCTIADSGIACLDSSQDSDLASISYESPSDQTVYLIVDNDYPSGGTTAELTAKVRQSCTPSSFTAACQGDEVVYCTNSGVQETYDCGTSGCSSARCVTTNAEFCYDARDLTSAASQAGGTTETIDFAQYANDFYVDGACGLLDTEIEGSDAYFSVNLQSGEVLVASLNQGASSDDPALAVVSADDCNRANSGSWTCQDSDEASSGAATVQYEATSAETVILIADVDEPGSTATMALDVEIREACDPATFTRVCRTDAVAYCKPDGFVETYDCGAGNCSGGTCTTTTADFCFDTQDLTSAAGNTGGTTVSVDLAQKSPLLSVDACGLTASETAGPEGVYRVDLTAGEILTANFDQGTSGAEPAVAIVEDCVDAANSCVAGAQASATAAEATYFARSDKTVYVIADTNQLNVSTAFSLTVTREQAPCASSLSGPACATNGDGVQICGDNGDVIGTTCSGCCTTAVGGSSEPDLAIPDDNPTGVSDTISISGCSNVTDVLIGVDIDHSWRGDIEVELTSPAGDTVLLHDNTGGSSDDLTGYYPLSLTAVGDLTTFENTDGNGTWTLNAADTVSIASGTLNSWSLALACQ